MSTGIPPSIAAFSGKSVASLAFEASESGSTGPADTISQQTFRGVGITIPTLDVPVFARGASFAYGDVVMFDLASSVATTYAFNGASTSVFCNVITPTAGGITAGFPIGVCRSAISQNDRGMVRIRGVATAFVIKTAGTTAVRPSDALQVTTAKNLTATFAAGNPYVGIALGTIGTGAMGTRSLLPVLLFGEKAGTYISGVGGGSGAYAAAGTGGGGTGA